MKDFISLHHSHTTSYEEYNFLTDALKDQFQWERFMIQVRLLAAWKNLVHNDRMAPCDATVQQTPHFFAESPGTMKNFSYYVTQNIL